MSAVHRNSRESLIDRDREALIAKVVAGTAQKKDRAQLEELSSARAALMKRQLTHRSGKRSRLLIKKVG